jgi:phage-related protein
VSAVELAQVDCREYPNRVCYEMAAPTRKGVRFLGRALDDLRLFPPTARQEAGHQIDLVQQGLDPDDWKPMTSIGAGVREIRISDDSGAFRVFYLTKVEDSIVILHCFQKKTAKTAQKDIKLARARYKSLFPPHQGLQA